MSAEFPLRLDWGLVLSEHPATLLASIRMWLEEVNPTCLVHPHGFFVVLLARRPDTEWRFHVWPKGTRPKAGMPAYIHTHDRHVESRVLQGELKNVLYDVTECLPHDGRPLYQVAYKGDRYAAATSNILQLTGTRVRAVAVQKSQMGVGASYHVERHAFHEAVVPKGRTTATLVCMHGTSQGNAMVVGLDGHPATIEFTRSERRGVEIADELSTD